MPLEVVVHVAIGPVEDRVDLVAVRADALHRLDRRASPRLLPPQSGKPGPDAEFGECALHRLDLVDLVVALDAGRAVLPQLAVPRLEPGRRRGRAIDPQVEVEPLCERIDEAVGLGKEIAGVDQDDRDARQHPCHEVQRHRGLGAEGRREDPRLGQQFRGTPDAGFGAEALHFRIQRHDVDRRRHPAALAHRATHASRPLRCRKSPKASPCERSSAQAAKSGSSAARNAGSSRFSR